MALAIDAVGCWLYNGDVNAGLSSFGLACQGSDDSMLARLIDEAMERAVYAIMEDEDAYWGEIPGFQGVWARHTTLEGCRRELREALSDWIAFRLSIGLPIPVIADLDLSQIRQPV